MITEQRLRDEIAKLIEALIDSDSLFTLQGETEEAEVDLEGHEEQIKTAIKVLRWVVQDGTKEAKP